jgi:DNA-binding transcriptional LysR family regulator
VLDLALDLRYLRCALVVAEQTSFRRAAITLDLSQSTVSRRVQLLERRLGFTIFVRDHRGVKLTGPGSDFLRDAVAGALQLDRAARLAAASHRGERGELRIGILASLATGFLHSLLRSFRTAHPEIQVLIHECSPHQALHGVAIGDLDISFVTGQPDMPGCTSKVLWSESIYVVLPEAHPLAASENVDWHDIRTAKFVVSRGGPGSEIQDYLIKMLSRPGFRPVIESHGVSRESLHSLVAMGYGIALTSNSSLSKLDGVVFRPVAGEENALQSSAVWSSGNTNPALAHLLRLAGKASAPAPQLPENTVR